MPRPKFKGKATKKNCRKYTSMRIKHEYKQDYPYKQSIAIGLSETRQAKPRCSRYIGKKK